MINIIKQFFFDYFPIIAYCIINLTYYFVAKGFRAKYFDRNTLRYKQSVKDDRIAGVCLAADRIVVLLGGLVVVIVSFAIKFLSANTIILYKWKRINRTITRTLYMIIVMFLMFPCLLVTSFVGLFGPYEAEHLDINRRK